MISHEKFVLGKVDNYDIFSAWKKVAECVYNSTSSFPRPSMFKDDTFRDTGVDPNSTCLEEDGDGRTGPCFERFATKGRQTNFNFSYHDEILKIETIGM